MGKKEPPARVLFTAPLVEAVEFELAVRINNGKRLVIRSNNGKVEVLEQSLLVTEEKRRKR